MPSTFSTNLGIELITTGEQAGTWGATTNTNLGTLIEQAISGYVAQVITDGADTVITIPSGSTGVARNMTLELTGALSAARNLIVPSNRKLYFIYNNTTGGYAVTVKVSGQTGVSVPNGAKVLLVSNGTDVVNAVNYIPALYFSAGTAAAPSISTIGDTNTGIYFPAADEVGVSTGGTERLRVNSSGNLGLGVTPSAWGGGKALQINARASLFGFSDDVNTGLNTYYDGTNFRYIQTGFASLAVQTAGQHRFFTAPSGTAGNAISFTQAMTLNSSGSLVVGSTTANRAGANTGISVEGASTSILEANINASRAGFLYADAASTIVGEFRNFPLLFRTNDTERARITSGGVFAVGRAAAVGSEMLSVNGGARLETFADIIGGAGTPELRLYQNSGNWAIQNSAGNLLFYDMDAAATRVTVDGSGNLGLGVTPSAWVSGAKVFQAGPYASFGQGRAGTSDLVVSWNAIVTSGTSSGTGYVYRNTGDLASSYEQNGSHRWYTSPSGTAGNAITFTQAMTLDSSGNLGIGTTSPGSRLEIGASGNIKLKGGAVSFDNPANNRTFNISAVDTPALVFTDASAGQERMRLDSSGNLGIGTSSPGYRLDVLGSATESGRVRTSGSINAFYLADSGTTVGSLYIGTVGNDFRIVTGSNETLRLTSSGNLGLGVTPSAWSVIKAIEIGGFRNALFSDNGSVSVGIVSGSYYNAGWKYALTGSNVGRYEIAGNTHAWLTAPSGTAGNAITFTQAMTLDASGNLAVGTSTTTNARVFSFVNDASLPGLGVRQDGAGPIQIWQSGGAVERARITSGGSWLVGTTAVTTSSFFSSVPAGVISASGDISLRLFRPTTGSGNGVAGLSFAGQDGSGNQVDVAVIRAEIGTNSASGALLFQTLPSGGGSGTITERARITSGGDFLVGTTATTGSQTNTTNAVVGKITSNNGSLEVAHNTATTMLSVTAAGASTFLVTVTVVSADTGSNYTVLGLLRCGGATDSYTNILTAAFLTVSLSGTNLQVTQTSGTLTTVEWSLLRLL